MYKTTFSLKLLIIWIFTDTYVDIFKAIPKRNTTKNLFPRGNKK